MQKLVINGKRELSGKISISGSKNATLPILAASILANQVFLKKIPLVKDIFTMIDLLNFIGLISVSYILVKTLFFSLNGYFETRYLATAIPFMEILVAFCIFYIFNKDFKNYF